MCGAELRAAAEPCYHQTLHSLRGQDLPHEVRDLSSTRVIPYPLQIDVMPSWQEIVTGAFVCGVLAIVSAGAVDIAYDTWSGWAFDARRNQSEGQLVSMPAPVASAWLQRASGGASVHGQIEQALLRGLDAIAHTSHGYRSRTSQWVPLADVIHHARQELPSAEEVVMHARLVAFEHEDVLEQLAAIHPRLVEALVELAHAQPIHD